MSNEITVLEEFVANAAAILSETEQNLQQLARTALTKVEQLSNSQENGEGTDNRRAATRLQQIGQQLANLSERSKTLQTYLQNGIDTPPANDEYWPRIRILERHGEERRQIARELEENVGELLANAVFDLASCQHLFGTDEKAVAYGLTALQSELEQSLTDSRHFITDFEPAPILSNFGLGGGIRRYLEQFEARTTIKTRLRINTNLGRLTSAIETAIFRVIQEALQNVQRHANATQVEVIFEETDTLLEFSIIDNGDGLVSDKIDISKKNLGLARMVDYAELLNGKVKIFSDLERGTRVTLSVPHHVL